MTLNSLPFCLGRVKECNLCGLTREKPYFPFQSLHASRLISGCVKEVRGKAHFLELLQWALPLITQQTACRSPGSEWGRLRLAHCAAAEGHPGDQEEEGGRQCVRRYCCGERFSVMSVAGHHPRIAFPTRCRWLGTPFPEAAAPGG